VPDSSAEGLFPGQRHGVRITGNYDTLRQFRISGAAHDAICHHPQCERLLFDTGLTPDGCVDVEAMRLRIKQDVRDIRDGAPLHRIEELERWRVEITPRLEAIPELVSRSRNTMRFLVALSTGMIVALAGAVFSLVVLL
jgi:hypothetical protein